MRICWECSGDGDGGCEEDKGSDDDRSGNSSELHSRLAFASLLSKEEYLSNGLCIV
jgi:hypothetical protein